MGYAYIILAATLWALFGPAARVALEQGLTPFEIALWRAIIAWALFVGHTIVVRTVGAGQKSDAVRRAIRGGDVGGLIAFGVVGVAALYVSLPRAVQSGGIALAVVLLYTAPAWVTLFAWLWLGERLTARKIAALALTLLGTAGVAIIGGGTIRPSPAAFGWGLLAGLSYASFSLFGKRYLVRYPPIVVFLYVLPIAALVLFPLTTLHTPSAKAWAALLVIGGCSTYGAYLAYSAGLARLEVSRAAIVATAEPIVGMLLAFIFWGERFAALGYVAAALVLAGVLLVVSARDAEQAGDASVPAQVT